MAVKSNYQTGDALNASDVNDIAAGVNAAEVAANKGQPNGYAGLDGNGRVPVTQLPNSIMQFQGMWDASTNTSPTLADGTGNAGDVYRVSAAGTQNFGSGAITFAVSDYVIYSGSAWEKADTTDAVSSVAGRAGAVTLTVADIGGDTSTALGVGTLEVGHASDTTLSRSASGVLAVEGVDIANVSAAQTFTNKRVTPRVGATSSSGTPTIDCGLYDQYNITALAVAITSVTISGTPTDGQKLLIRIKDNGSARAIAWGASFSASGAAALPTTTVATKTHLLGFIYDSTAAKWVIVAADATGY